MWIAIRGLRDDEPWRWAAAFALVVAAFGALNTASLGYALFPAALTCVGIAVFEHHSARRLWSWIWRSAVLGVLTCSAAIVVLWYNRPEVSANLRTTELPDAIARTSSWFESWRGLGSWLTYFSPSPESAPYFTEPGVIVASFVAPVVAVLALVVIDRRQRLLLGSMMLASLVLMVGGYPLNAPSPFGRVLMAAFDQSSTLRGFRATYKAGAALMIATALLVGVAAAATWRRAPPEPDSSVESDGSMSLPSVRHPVIGALVALVGLALVLASFPFWTGRLYAHQDTYGDIPEYWEDAFDHLATLEQPGRVVVLPRASRFRHRWGYTGDNLFDGMSSLSPLINGVLPPGTAESADLVSAIDEYVASPGYVDGTIGPILDRIGVQWVMLLNDLDWQQMNAPRPSTYDALRSDPGLDLAMTFGGAGTNTSAPTDSYAGLLGENELPPVELYRVVDAAAPEPRLESGPPLLVAGAGDAWPTLSAAGLLDGPPIAYTGAADDDVLRKLVASGAPVVVTDGNRRRAKQATAGRNRQSPTLTSQEPHVRDPSDLFGGASTQSVATFADAAWITASRYGPALSQYETASRPANAFDGIGRTAWKLNGAGGVSGESMTIHLADPVTVTGVSVEPFAEDPLQRRLTLLEVVTRSSEGAATITRVPLSPGPGERTHVVFEATDVATIDVLIAASEGDDASTSVGISEMVVDTPDGPLDLREFVRTPEDLAVRAASDAELNGLLAEDPPRYELRRQIGLGVEEEETELRREIATFGNHQYDFTATVRVTDRTPPRTVRRLRRALTRSDCAPFFAVDAEPVTVRSVTAGRDRLGAGVDLRDGEAVELEGCGAVRLAPGRHRIESEPAVSGSVLTASLVPLRDRNERRRSTAEISPGGTVEVTSRSPTRSEVTVAAPVGTLLIGGMPAHDGWVADDNHLHAFPVPLDTFAAWTIEDDNVRTVTLRFAPQRWYELAMALSVGASVWCLLRVTRRRQRSNV